MLLEAQTATHESIETLHESDDGSLVAARDAQGSDILLFVPRNAETGARERERLEFLRGPGIPVAQRPTGDGGEAIVLEGASAARPLRAAAGLPDGVWRRALVHLLSALSHVHGCGVVHGRISRGHILADPSGEFWLCGWAGSRNAVGRGPFQAGIDDVGMDVRDLGIAFVRHFGDVATDTEDLDEAAVDRATARVAIFDRELARVLRRLVAADPHEGYENTSEVLTDLGERDESLHDPFADLPFVGRSRIVRSILAHAGRAGTRDAWLGSFEIVGAPGSGKTRLLDETARAARDRGYVVMRSHGGAAHQPWGALGNFARQMVARLPGDHALRTQRGVRILIGECPSATGRETDLVLGDGTSVALADLATESFSGVKGLLLLDDEDALSSHALRVWRDLGRHVATTSGSSQAAAVLLVTTSSRASPDELGVPRERVQLEDLARRHLTQMLGVILTERGKSPILAAELHAIAGGRPGDLVDHLRDSLERRTLVAVGHKYHVEDPAGAVRAGVGLDRFRRAVDAAGRDGMTLASAIAVAGRLRLPREALGEITELGGHHLHAAAESAIRAGLLERDGPTWRTRTQSLAERLQSTLPDDRRRSLHREFLARLLEADPPDWPAIAHHGRNAGDSRAADWTRTALTVLRTAGRHDEAAAHLDDARTLLDPADLDVDLRLLQVDTLLNAGRLGDAMRVANEIVADPVATPKQHGIATLALARLHRYDQAWSRVVAIDLPLTCRDPVILAKIRLLRGTAHVMMGQAELGAREARLALAEVGDDAAARAIVEVEALDYHSIDALLLAADHRRAAATTLLHMRFCRSQGRHLDVALDLVQFANLCRARDATVLARAILRRALDHSTTHLGNNALLKTWCYSTESLVDKDRDLSRRRIAAAAAASLYAARTGATTLALNKRIQLAHAQACGSVLPASTARFVRNLAATVRDTPLDEFSFAAHHIAYLFVFLGQHSDLATLHQRLLHSGVNNHYTRLAAYWHFMANCLVDILPVSVETLAESGGILHCLDTVVSAVHPIPPMKRERDTRAARRSSDAACMFIAACVRRGLRQTLGWPSEFTDVGLMALLESAEADDVAKADLVLSLMLDPALPADTVLWGRLRAAAERLPRRLPLAVEWRRALAYARLHWRERRFSTAARLAREAERQLIHLADINDSATVKASLHNAQAAIPALALVLPPVSTLAIRGVSHRQPVSASSDSSAYAAVWRRELELTAPQSRAIIVSPHRRELQVFAETVATVTGRKTSWLHTWDCDPYLVPQSLLCVQASVLDDRNRLRVSMRYVDQHIARGSAALLLTSASLANLRSLGGEAQALVEMLEGPIVHLPRLCAGRDSRARLMRTLLPSCNGVQVPLDPAVAQALTEHNWPGGLAEFESMIASIATVSDRPVTMRTLAALGWGQRVSGSDLIPGLETIRHVQAQLATQPWQSSRDISRGVRRPSRTTVRLLSVMLRHGMILRRGRGRATRYSLSSHVDLCL